MPQRNRCWFAARVVAVRQRWALTIDAREANGPGGCSVRLFNRQDALERLWAAFERLKTLEQIDGLLRPSNRGSS